MVSPPLQVVIIEPESCVILSAVGLENLKSVRAFAIPWHKAEWDLPISYRTPCLSQSHDLEGIPPADGAAFKSALSGSQ